MALIERAKNILLTPKTEWPVIAVETETVQSLYTGYIVILSAIGPLAMIIGGNVIAGIVAYVIGLVVTYVLALIVDALAPTFGGEKNFVASLKLVAYSYTAAWVAGIFQLLPFLGGIIGLLAAIYSFYTFYLGVPVLKKGPPEKALGYTIVVVLCGIALGVVLAAVLMSLFVGTAGLAGMSGMGF